MNTSQVLPLPLILPQNRNFTVYRGFVSFNVFYFPTLGLAARCGVVSGGDWKFG